MDFYKILVKENKSNNRSSDFLVYPDFVYSRVSDLICKGGEMYAFWYKNSWRTDIDDLIDILDLEINEKVKELTEKYPYKKTVGKYMRNASSGIMDEFVKYCKNIKQSECKFNTKIFFDGDDIKKTDYSTTKLSYRPLEGPTKAFDEMFTKLYDQEQLDKVLYFLGALYMNKMKDEQKFLFFYGSKGSGKGTFLKIIKEMFEGYFGYIGLKQLTGGGEFATSQVQELPMLIDEDTDISRVTDDINLLKLTGHETLIVNSKYKRMYNVTFEGLLLTASNQRYQVRNIDSGIVRRAIVVEPSNRLHDSKTYDRLMNQIKFEIPQIANKCIQTYLKYGPHYYQDYVDINMVENTDLIYSFVKENYLVLGETPTLKRAAELYKNYLEDLGYETKGYKQRIKTELQRYYDSFHTSYRSEEGIIRNMYQGFKYNLVFNNPEIKNQEDDLDLLLKDAGLLKQKSIFDDIAKTYPAQLTNDRGFPLYKWENVNTTLKDIDTEKLHYVKIPTNHIVIDFDLPTTTGEKDLKKNLEEALKFPPTYMELSKSGKGVHLHYYYDGDTSSLARLYSDFIEVKTYNGNSSLRRKLSYCNSIPITHLTSGLPIKDKKGSIMYQDIDCIIWDEKKMRTAIKGNLEKKYHPNTKPSVDFIVHIFNQAEQKGVKYDLRDMRQDILVFATKSTNQSQECLKQIAKINYCTIEEVDIQPKTKIVPIEEIYFFDLEVLPNFFGIAYKKYGKNNLITKLINPTSEQIENLLKLPLVGYNNRRYDNHILYAALLGHSNLELYRQSQRIIKDKNAGSGMYSAAYELSYADIYEYITDKKSLKKWEVELGIDHDEFEFPWDQPLPEDQWDRCMEYCANDVLATEAVFNHTIADYEARLILAELSGASVNAKTQTHAAKFLFGDDPRPQDKFIYTDLATMFPGYKYEFGKSTYKGEDPSEGGYVYSKPGVYENVGLFDIASMHPTSLIELNYFGPYTQLYADLKKTRLYIKHKEFDKAGKMFGGRLKKYLNEKHAKALSFALKIIINIIYGMTSAKFDNVFRHPLNDDNIVAKRGALFMIDLKNACLEQGFEVVHIKTDSIKIANTNDKIKDFIFDFGKKYGYDFEHEATYDKMALVNKSVYIAKENDQWLPTGAMFAEPYVFKTLFTREEIELSDYSFIKQATSPIYLGDKFIGKLANVYASCSGEDLIRKDNDKISFITGTKGYKWKLYNEDIDYKDIDKSYYYKLVKDAIKSINDVGDITKIIDQDYYNKILDLIS